MPEEPPVDDNLGVPKWSLRDDPDEAKRLGRQGREYVLRHYDRDRLAMSYLDAVDRVVGSAL